MIVGTVGIKRYDEQYIIYLYYIQYCMICKVCGFV